jgi:hypothetical protein
MTRWRTLWLFAFLGVSGLACRHASSAASRADAPSGPPSTSPPDVGLDSGKTGLSRFDTTAIHVQIGDLGLGDFVSDDPPSAEHPRGTLAVVAERDSPGRTTDSGQQFVMSIDLATLTEIGRALIGPAHPTMLARASAGLALAVEEPDAIVVIWLDAGPSVRARYRVPKVPSGHEIGLRGLAAVGDRLVLVVDDFDRVVKERTVAMVLDDQAQVIAKHICPGGLPRPSPPAAIDLWGQRVVLTELKGRSGTVACAFGLDARAGTLTAEFPGLSSLFLRDGTLYAETFGGDSMVAHRLGDDLRPTGPALSPELAKPPALPKCTAITGTTWQEAMIEGLLVTQTVSCCGDSAPSGLWVCDPAHPSSL